MTPQAIALELRRLAAESTNPTDVKLLYAAAAYVESTLDDGK